MSHLVKPLFGLGYYFNGVDNHVLTSKELPTAYHSFSATAWIYRLSEKTSDDVIVSNSKGGGYYKHLHIVVRGNKPYFGFYGDDLRGATYISKEKWWFLGFTYDYENNIRRIYVNAKVDAEDNPSQSLIDNIIADVGKFADLYFYGIMGEFRFYNRVLSETEMNEMYTIRRNILDGCELLLGTVGLVRGGGTQWLDESGHGNHGTVYGAIRVRCCHCNPVVRYGTATPI